MSLTNKRIAFVEHYLICWNATEAARHANYAHPNMAGPRLMVNDCIKAHIEVRLTEIAMSADMVLARLTALVSERDVITLRALELLGKHHRLFVDVKEVMDKDDAPADRMARLREAGFRVHSNDSDVDQESK